MATQTGRPVYPEPEDFPETEDVLDENADDATEADVANPALAEPAPHVEYSYSPDDFACVRCGSRNIAKGYIVDYGDKFDQTHFAPQRVTLRFLNSIRALRPWRSLAKLNAEACRDCGLVMIVVDPSELRRAEHQRD
ncbi:MAG TPA: hypothetical protein VKQ72_14665 [Aggregatilineales bacterium]|nr:hypothetical protein [Aggregatilineales bacterium]